MILTNIMLYCCFFYSNSNVFAFIYIVFKIFILSLHRELLSIDRNVI